jgi:hypothetical protein
MQIFLRGEKGGGGSNWNEANTPRLNPNYKESGTTSAKTPFSFFFSQLHNLSPSAQSQHFTNKK